MKRDVGDRIRIEKDKACFEGTVIEGPPEEITVRLDSGYIAGFIKDGVHIFESENFSSETTGDLNSGQDEAQKYYGHKKIETKNTDMRVTILAVGGTIACTYDPKTHSIKPSVTVEEMLADIPELNEYAVIKTRQVDNILSENMGPEHWKVLAEAVYDEIKGGADGIIITSGTDTLAYIASAISFIVETPVPIVITGAQKSPDRPSSDNHMNLICSVKAAVSDIGETVVVMHATLSDDFCHIHRATRVRKMHTTRRDTFQSLDIEPLGEVDYKKDDVRMQAPYVKRGEKRLVLHKNLEEKCALIKFFPGADPKIIDWYIENGYKGLVIEGVGLGHVSENWIPYMKKAHDRGVIIVMASQCLSGRINFAVYETGRKIKEAGVVGAEDMLPETALIKLMWVLGQTQKHNEVKKYLQTDLRKETAPRHTVR